MYCYRRPKHRQSAFVYSFFPMSASCGVPRRRLVRVAQWNILADGLAQTGSFAYCPLEELHWERRLPRIAERLHVPAASGRSMLLYDFATLQEVNRVDSLTGKIGGHLVKYVFEAKTPSPTEALGYPSDGCAILYDASEWTILRHEGIPFYDEDPDRTPHAQRGLVGLFQANHTAEGQHVMICSMHFKAKEGQENERKRLAQAKQLKAALARIRKHWTEELELPRVPPLIIGCDMNDVSGSSPHTEMLSEEPNEGMRLDSAYATERQLFTTWKFRHDVDTGEVKEVERIIDYIFYEKSQLQVQTCSELPSKEELGPSGIPSAEYPSDHLQLSATFNLDDYE
eukprot:gb/GECG01000840.1/.p1 GENE.gb/GECG01000840.1/~~gb/GECG01000840.1/.p1  ORF type:complete len:341 (+),score=35.65 gb/GECG01000840.1/:1-1023(+)